MEPGALDHEADDRGRLALASERPLRTVTAQAAVHHGRLWHLWQTARLPWKRRQLLRRAVRAQHDLTALRDRTDRLPAKAILCFSTMRNELPRLPEFLAHYRGLGIGHFLIVDNASTDGTTDCLLAQPDVSLWRTGASYRDSRFGMDWLGFLLARHGHGHWCLTVDADEILIYPDWQNRDLTLLTSHLDRNRISGMGALMLDLYPSGLLGQTDAPRDAPLTQRLSWFDAGPYRCEIQRPKQNRWVQGGVRERMFFAGEPWRSPTLNKLPLLRWHRSHVYVNSTHSLLPAHLNGLYDGPGNPRLSGVLLHGKFLPEILIRSHEELKRRQHFHDPDAFADYHRALTRMPGLWCESSVRYENWQQLVDLRLMGAGKWLD
jgi:hypothetical protein